MNGNSKVLSWIGVILVLCAMMIAAFAALKTGVVPESQAVAVQVEPAKPIAGLETAKITHAKVKAYTHQSKKALALPQAVIEDGSKYALGAATVKPGLHPVTVSTVLDADTGEVTQYEKQEPLPWVAPAIHGEAGIAYGIKDGNRNGRLFLRQGLVDVKAMRLGVEATADQDGSLFAGASLAYRW